MESILSEFWQVNVTSLWGAIQDRAFATRYAAYRGSAHGALALHESSVPERRCDATKNVGFVHQVSHAAR